MQIRPVSSFRPPGPSPAREGVPSETSLDTVRLSLRAPAPPDPEPSWRNAFLGAALGAGVSTAACLVVARGLPPLAAVVIFSSTVVGGTVGYNNGNVSWDPSNDPQGPWF